MKASVISVCLLASAALVARSDSLSASRERGSLQGFLLRTRVPGEYVLRLQQPSGAAFSYTVDPSQVRVFVRDHHGRNVPDVRATASHEMPAPGMDYRSDNSPGTEYLRVLVDEWRLKPGMYEIGARVRARATDDATGQPVSLPETVTGTQRFYKTPEPDYAPALLPGRKFLFIPRNAPDLVEPAPPGTPPYPEDPDDPTLPRPPRRAFKMPYTDAETGTSVPITPFILKVFTLKRNEAAPDGKRALTFAVEGVPDLLRLVTERPATGLPHLAPILTDDTARRLKTKFEGKKVWMSVGGAECVTDDPNGSGDFGFDGDHPVFARRVVRVWRPFQTLAIGGAPGYMGPRDSEFVFDNPMVVVLDVPREAAITSASWSGFGPVGDEDFDIQSMAGQCAGTCTMYADAWDMERDLSLQDPRVVRNGWPKRFRKAVAAGEMMKGMTPDMVAQVLGWPNEYGSPDEMRRWDAWRYDSTPPYNYWVNFRHGRVVGFGPDGTLP